MWALNVSSQLCSVVEEPVAQVLAYAVLGAGILDPAGLAEESPVFPPPRTCL